MKKTWKSSVLLIGTAMLGAIALSGMNAMAGDLPTPMEVDVTLTSTLVEDVTRDMDFGSIEVNPAGCTVTIDASAGTAVAASTGTNPATVTGGESGQVTITSLNGFPVSAVYPATITLTGSAGALGETLTVTDVDTYSEGGTTNGSLIKTPGTNLVFNVGGEIIIPAGAVAGPYNGNFTITVNYI